MSNTFDRSAILESFLDEVTSYLPEIDANLDRLQQRPDDEETIEETYRRAHTIAGSAAMMEFGALARVAQGMEDILGEAIDHHATLDIPTIGLLRRSAARLSRLVEHIRTGADDTPVVREDDADRIAWRGGAGQAAGAAGASPPQPSQYPDVAAPNWLAAGIPAAAPPPGNGGNAGPSQLPDWLTAFANPQFPTEQGASGVGTPPAGGFGWQPGQMPPPPPDQPSPAIGAQPGAPTYPPAPDPWSSSLSQFETGRMGAFAPTPAGTPGRMPAFSEPQLAPTGAPESFDDILRAFSADEAEEPLASYSTAVPPTPEHGLPFANSARAPSTPAFDISNVGTSALPAMSSSTQEPTLPSLRTPAVRPPGAAGGDGQGTLDELRMDEEAVRRQVGALRTIVASLREASQAMEDERAELRGFLDGSRDALERLEDWAGQQMGLDLRQSPDSVRRYLPLSVIWVTTTRLKRLVGLLNNSGRGLTATQEQIEETLNELRRAIEGVGRIYQTVTSLGGAPDAGFSATVAQIAWAPPVAPPTPAVPSAESLAPGARAELEHQVRDQLRRELEDEVRAEVATEVRRDEEQRLRQELQIQVRRELLSELTPNMGASGIIGGDLGLGGGAPAHMPYMGDRSVKPVRVTNELSPEALEVFREEAQEHLLTITTGIANLEANPADAATLQSIRRAMHTLKGAAGMMGFGAIQQIAHASEDLLDRLVEGAHALSPALVGLLLDTSDTLDQLVRGLISGEDDERRAQQSLVARYAQVMGKPVEMAREVLPSSAAHPEAIAIATGDETDDQAGGRSGDEKTDLSVRLQLSKLDNLVNLFGELLVNRSSLEERVDRLGRMVGDATLVGERLRDVGSQLETRFEAATLPSGRSASGSSGGDGGTRRWGLGALRRAPNGARGEPGGVAQDFDPLELDRYNEFHRLSRGLGEGVVDIVTLTHEMETLVRECQASFARENRLSSDFQDRLLRARLVPLQSLMPRLYRAARTSAAREGKEIEFFTEGADIEVDRKVFEELTGPLLHMVRNAVNHAIEPPDARERAGKPRAGTITVSASYEGNQVVIAVRDDGAGIDANSIRQTAIARGWIDAYTPLSDKEAINLIFQQGITTAHAVTEESGRGVGLDVVRDTVTRLRGTIEVESTVGQGATFILKLPISLQIARAVLVKAGGQTFAIPMAVVDQIGRFDYYPRSAGTPATIEMRGERYVLAHLAQYLHLQHPPVEQRSSVLLVNAGRRRVALLVDGIVAQQEIVSKPLGPHLREVRGVAGAAVLGNGQVVLILELHELLAVEPPGTLTLPVPGAHSDTTPASLPSFPSAPVAAAQSPFAASAPANTEPQRAAPSAPTNVTARPTEPTLRHDVVAARPQTGSGQQRATLPPAPTGRVLVVDDSPSVRRVVGNMLKSHGWEVQTARDGVEALEAIARQQPSAVLLDIEMPRMDGYELLATIRSQPQYRNLPLIVLTSRAATKHQQRASQLGADAYVVKPYQDEELLTTIATLVQARGALT